MFVYVNVSSICFVVELDILYIELHINVCVNPSVERVFDLTAVLKCVHIATANSPPTPTMSTLECCFGGTPLSHGMINGHCKANCRTTFVKTPQATFSRSVK